METRRARDWDEIRAEAIASGRVTEEGITAARKILDAEAMEPMTPTELLHAISTALFHPPAGTSDSEILLALRGLLRVQGSIGRTGRET